MDFHNLLHVAPTRSDPHPRDSKDDWLAVEPISIRNCRATLPPALQTRSRSSHRHTLKECVEAASETNRGSGRGATPSKPCADTTNLGSSRSNADVRRHGWKISPCRRSRRTSHRRADGIGPGVPVSAAGRREAARGSARYTGFRLARLPSRAALATVLPP